MLSYHHAFFEFIAQSENPEGFKNKDFRYTLSMIYQIIEDEFEGTFTSPYTPVRNTNFFLINFPII